MWLRIFVKRVLWLLGYRSKKTNIRTHATASRAWWYAIERCFFLMADSAPIEIFVTDSLSQKTLQGPYIGTPNMRSLYRRAISISTSTRIATNSEPKVLASTLFWRFENYIIGAILRYTSMPVCERRVVNSPAWAASTNALIWTLRPRGRGIFGGRKSLKSGYIVLMIAALWAALSCGRIVGSWIFSFVGS